jgi:hypothetical protein
MRMRNGTVSEVDNGFTHLSVAQIICVTINLIPYGIDPVAALIKGGCLRTRPPFLHARKGAEIHVSF